MVVQSCIRNNDKFSFQSDGAKFDTMSISSHIFHTA